jgi:hypothetical protein
MTKKLNTCEPKVAKIKHTRNENGQNFTHQNKTTLFWRKKAKINLHHHFPIYGSVLWKMLTELFVRSYFQQNKLLIYFLSFLWHKSSSHIKYVHICKDWPHWYFILDTGLILWSIELFIYIQTCVNVNAYPIKKYSLQ